MKISTLRKLIFQKNIFSFLKLSRRINTLYSVSFAVAANRHGVLSSLSKEGKDILDIAHDCGIPSSRLSAFETWLTCGVQAGELVKKDNKYQVKGKLSKHLMRESSKIASAMFEEVGRYHYDAILNAPAMMISSKAYSLSDQNPEVIAQSSRILEPFVEEAIDWVFSDSKVSRVLEVGFGSGIYVKYMKELWPHLSVVAIDYQKEVVELAQKIVRQEPWAFNVEFKFGDITQYSDTGRFDLITLHNNLYYIPTNDRLALFENLNRLCALGGKIVLTSSFKGGTAAISALDLWFSLSDLGTSLPHIDDIQQLAHKAGFSRVQVKSLMPGDTYYAVTFTKKRELARKEQVVHQFSNNVEITT